MSNPNRPLAEKEIPQAHAKPLSLQSVVHAGSLYGEYSIKPSPPSLEDELVTIETMIDIIYPIAIRANPTNCLLMADFSEEYKNLVVLKNGGRKVYLKDFSIDRIPEETFPRHVIKDHLWTNPLIVMFRVHSPSYDAYCRRGANEMASDPLYRRLEDHDCTHSVVLVGWGRTRQGEDFYLAVNSVGALGNKGYIFLPITEIFREGVYAVSFKKN